jgi:S1/P1 Nuclease
MKRLAFVAAATLSILCGEAHAWNGRGHMMVAAVAWTKMTPVARAKASALIRRNPSYATWIQGVSPSELDAVAFITAATWPDEIRSNPSYTDDGYTPTDPSREQNIGYTDMLLHRYWHFKDTPFSTDGTALAAAFSPNAVTQIARFSTTLGDTTVSDEVKSYDLAWLLHLVGDIHQPLHATSRFSKASRDGDNGGNGVKVCLDTALLCDKDHASKLHSFWDGAVGTSEKPSSVFAQAKRLPSAPAQDLLVGDPETWAQESFKLSKQAAYVAPIGADKGPFRLTKNYRVVAGSVAERRIALAGERLANILNAQFK